MERARAMRISDTSPWSQASNDLAQLVARNEVSVFVDVSPLFDPEWTGIPIVAAQLCRQFLRVIPDAVEFFSGTRRVAKAAVIDALASNSGRQLIEQANDSVLGETLDVFMRNGPVIGFFPSVKQVRGFFDLEFSVIHDLSPLINPEFHDLENLRYHLDYLVPNLHSNAITFCVSQSTFDDVHQYFGIPQRDLAVMYNGVEWPESYGLRFEQEFGASECSPYIVVLGTREDRKNLGRIYSLLADFPRVLEQYEFVFIGKLGQGGAENVPTAIMEAVSGSRVRFTGFVSEYEKYKLLRGARASMYASLFEGFGLPVLESLAVGTPCLLSYSSSMPEVAGDTGFYFDPLSTGDMYRAIRRLGLLSPDERARLSARCIEAAGSMTWAHAFSCVASRMIPFLATPKDG